MEGGAVAGQHIGNSGTPLQIHTLSQIKKDSEKILHWSSREHLKVLNQYKLCKVLLGHPEEPHIVLKAISKSFLFHCLHHPVHVYAPTPISIRLPTVCQRYKL